MACNNNYRIASNFRMVENNVRIFRVVEHHTKIKNCSTAIGSTSLS